MNLTQIEQELKIIRKLLETERGSILTYLNAKQAANYIGIAYSTLKRDWVKWTSQGVNPSRYMGTKQLRFKRSDLDHLMHQWRVIKDP